MNNKPSIWKELREWRRYYKLSKQEKSIVFYAEHSGYFSYFEGIIKELTQKRNQSIIYITSDHSDHILQNNGVRIKPFYFNTILPLFMIFAKCKVFVMTLTDLNQFHLKRSINQVHYVYVFHAAVSTHMMYRFGAFDHYDSILCVGGHQVEEIRKHEEMQKLPAKKLVEAGYYRLERIYDAYKQFSNKSSCKKTILIAPSWGEKNVLESCGKQLVEILLQNDYAVIVRPHPETVKRTPELLRELSKKFGGNPSFRLETSVSGDESLLRADVLISDCSGIMIEYAFATEKPFISIDVPLKIKNPRYPEIGEPLELLLRSKIGRIVSIQEIDKIPAVILNLIKSKNKCRREIVKLRKQYVFNFGESSKVGADYILDLLFITAA